MTFFFCENGSGWLCAPDRTLFFFERDVQNCYHTVQLTPEEKSVFVERGQKKQKKPWQSFLLARTHIKALVALPVSIHSAPPRQVHRSDDGFPLRAACTSPTHGGISI